MSRHITLMDSVYDYLNDEKKAFAKEHGLAGEESYSKQLMRLLGIKIGKKRNNH